MYFNRLTNIFETLYTLGSLITKYISHSVSAYTIFSRNGPRAGYCNRSFPSVFTPDKEAEYCDECVCVSLCVSVHGHIFGTARTIFSKICVLVTWPWLGPQRRRPAEAQCTCSFGLGYKLCAVIPVAGQRTHGTTFWALKVTSQVATLGGGFCGL